MTATDLFWHVTVNVRWVENDIAFLELAIKYTSDLLKNLTDLEGSYILGE